MRFTPLILFFALSLSGPALAQLPRLAVDGAGACPTPEKLKRAVADFTRRPTGNQAHYRVLLVPHEDRASDLKLFDGNGREEFTRRIDSQDCDSLAEAYAIIIKAHFVDLGLDVEAKNDDDDAVTSVAPEGAPAADASVERSEEAPVAPTTATPSPPRSEPGEAADTVPRWRFAAGLGGGIQVDSPELTAPFAGQLELALMRGSLGVRLSGRWTNRVVQGDAPNRVERRTFAPGVSLLARFGTRWFLEPALGFMVVGSRVKARDLRAAESTRSLRPAWEVALRGAYDDLGPLAVWLEVAGHVMLDRDRYLARQNLPDGSQGQRVLGLGPRAGGHAMLGLSVDFLSF